MTVSVKPLKFEQQINYFRKKLNIATESYLDVWGEEHDYLFMVAGAHRNDLVADLRKLVDKVIAEGMPFAQFKAQFATLSEQHRWAFRGGLNWRARIIYETNLLASYNRGRLAQQLELKTILPYWEYRHNDSDHPRPEHQAWEGLILHCDDPWWRYHYPVKVYGSCYCTVIAYSEADLARMGRKPDKAPPIEWEEKTVGQRIGTPRTVRVVKGCDPGFEPTDFNHPYADRLGSVDKVLMQKMVNAHPKTAAAAVRNVLSYPAAMHLMSADFKQTVTKIAQNKQASGEFKYVGVLPEEIITQLEARAIPPQSAVIAIRGEDILHALRDHKSGVGIGLSVEFWQQLPQHLMTPDAILLETDQALPTLLFVYKTEQGKVAVKVNYEIKLRNQQTGKKERVTVNMIRTGSVISEQQLRENLTTYELLWGSL